MLIDYGELGGDPKGERLEQLTRAIGQRLGLSPEWSGRGPDRGRDLYFTEKHASAIRHSSTKWLVSCKDHASSNSSVQEAELPNITDKLRQHSAQGFLLVTTTTVSTAAKDVLDALNESIIEPTRTQVWDRVFLDGFLLSPDNHDIVKEFFSESYKRVRGLTTVEGAILSFAADMPDSILDAVRQLVRPYAETSLKGSVISPGDESAADAIDKAMEAYLLRQDISEMASATGDIPPGVIEVFVSRLADLYQSVPEDYLSALIATSADHQVKRKVFDIIHREYELSPADHIRMLSYLDQEDLAEILSVEVTLFIEQELYLSASDYGLWNDIDQLSERSSIDDVYIEEVEFAAGDEGVISFSGDMTLTVGIYFDRGEINDSRCFPGRFRAHMDEQGIFLDDASVDTRSFYE